MAKDPAFLFYSQDFLVGTMFMTNEQVGKYIKLLCIQHQKGGISKSDMESVCNGYDEVIYSKFIIDNNTYYNARLKEETVKRNKYVSNRLKNFNKYKSMETHMEPHMETHTENENENEDEDVFISLKEKLKENYDEYVSLIEELYEKIISRKPRGKEYDLLCDEYIKNKERLIKANKYTKGDKNFFDFSLVQTKILGGLYE